MPQFDLCVIGSGPGGQKAAIQAARLGRSVCVVEKMEFVGGVAINTGTIPSKALREAVLDVLAARRRGSEAFDALDRRRQLAELAAATQRVVRAEIDIARSQLVTAGVEIYSGVGSLVDQHTVQVQAARGTQSIHANHILIAAGTTPARPPGIPFDDVNVITSDEIIRLPYLPRSMIVVGGGVIGTEYASMLSALGVRVTLIEGRARVLDFVDAEITEALQYHLRQAGMTLRLGEQVVRVSLTDPPPSARPDIYDSMVEAQLESGKTIRADSLLYAVGRQGATDALNLPAVGLEADSRGRIKVDANYRTGVPTISAVGDVIGFPALASTSMEQGRLAACAMFGQSCPAMTQTLPYGIYSIPEISMVGWTEERLTAENIPYVAGVAHYRETARGQLLNDQTGMLKLLIHQDSRVILGVHAIGTGATELIHIGQAVMAFQGTVDYFVETVFNYPTLAECYKVAAQSGLARL
ncbi:MAG TPA: Si-specific NAD(P)(+) transhydrogenase [Phycisphaerales bacterium]|nr:Si-specific NAD(P)(+) transhydrogenase [Phycisphaerales bacterium]